MKHYDHNKEKFMFLSDAKSFQRKKRKQGYRTKLVNCLGIVNPYREVHYWKVETHTIKDI